MQKLNEVFSTIGKVIHIIASMYLFFVLGYSIFSRTQILELEWFDSQWWILLFVVNMGLKTIVNAK